jgi:hypothetical protein
MYSDNKQIRDVADVAARIMAGLPPIKEALHPNQQKIDVVDDEKIDGKDFAKLRAGKKPDVKKEEVEELDELSKSTLSSYAKKGALDSIMRFGKASTTSGNKKPDHAEADKAGRRYGGVVKAIDRLAKEEVESIDEEDAYEKDRYAVKNGKAVKDNPTHQGSPNYKDQPHHVYATSAENALKNHTKKEEVAEGFKFNSHERGAAERLKDMRKNEKEAEKMDKQYSAMRKKREQDKLKKEEVELDEKISISYKVPTDNENFGAKPGDKTRFDKSPNITRKMQLHRDVTAKAVKSVRAQGGNPANHPDIKINKEEIEQMDEVKMADLPSTKVQGRAYGASRPEPHAVDTMKGPNDAELKKIETEKKKKKFSEMVNLYQDKGLKSLSEMLAKEESTEDEFNKEIEDAKAKDAGKKKNTEIAKGAVQAVKTEETHTTVEVIDLNDVNGVQYSEIELAQERTLTEPEMKKKEEIVKSMKKGLSGFKDRYGDRAKEVMYATATARAKGE